MKALFTRAKISGLGLMEWLVVLAVLAGVLPVFAQVTNLGIAPAGNQFILYWPAGNTNYVLQTTTNLTTPGWNTATNAVTVNAVVVTNSAPDGYFRLIEDSATAGMVLIPAGSFLMGNCLFYDSATNDPDIVNADPTNIYVSSFYMDTNLVSYNQWQSVYTYATNHGYSFTHGYGFTNVGSGKAANHPVQMVNWFNCVRWCNARSQQAGLKPVYYSDVEFTQLYTNGFDYETVYMDFTNNGYRLPTEAEWEKAARGGLSGLRFPWGNMIDWSHANYWSARSGGTAVYSYDLAPVGGYDPAFTNGAQPYTSPAGSFAPNGYGLYDMAGNVWQWCWDWYGTPYGQPTTTNPTGPATGVYKVMRGGYWEGSAEKERCAFRKYEYHPDYFATFIGFRCVRGL